MQILSLQLRNYRVFESLDLELPPGVVGVYGPNGSGKSTLLESILWGLYGRARTQKGDIRSTGTTGECSVEVTFEHDGHMTRVRRSISGVNSTVKARLWVGEQVAADGPSDVDRFVHSLLGMDHSAFRASVFAEQKQIAAFSDQAPDRRRQLVLQLLGITPLEKARDAARSDAKQRQADHQRLLTILPELGRLEERLELAAGQADTARGQHELTVDRAAGAAAVHEASGASLGEMEAARHRHELIRQRGSAVRDRLDRATAEVQRLDAELAALSSDTAGLDELRVLAAQVDVLEQRASALRAHDTARVALEALPVVVAPVLPDPSLVSLQRQGVQDAAAELAVVTSQLESARGAVAAAETAVQHTHTLSGTAECPLCGQALGEGFATVRRHREDELQVATERLRQLEQQLPLADASVKEARRTLTVLEREADAATKAAIEADTVLLRRSDAAHALTVATDALGPVPDDAARAALEEQRQAARRAVSEVARLQGRLEAWPSLRIRLSEQQELVAAAGAERQQLLRELQAVGFDATKHARMTEDHQRAEQLALSSRRAADDAAIQLAAADAARSSLAEQLDEARRQHLQVAEMSEDARHLARTADLLQGFRHLLVGLIGPRLSIQASDLFNELTGNEYDGLEVHPDSYELRILDRGTSYPTSRFSGSEIDLANLALRVAISEQVRFQAGGQIGLLVLDEALASLDADRKDRMLTALTRLGGRFRQILVVTHAPEVKEQLPQAIEVVRLGPRRSTARVIDPSF